MRMEVVDVAVEVRMEVAALGMEVEVRMEVAVVGT